MVEIQTGPLWKPVLSAQVQFAPVTSAIIRRARAAYRAALAKAVEATGQAFDEKATITLEAAEDAVAAFLRSVTVDGIVAWKGLTAQGTKKALALTPEHVDAALSDPDFGPVLSGAYALAVWQRELEKNASSPSRAGAIAGSKAKKKPASRSMASGSAPPAPAARTVSPTPIGKAKANRPRRVPSTATPARPKTAKPSGT